jgi:MazG family protein
MTTARKKQKAPKKSPRHLNAPSAKRRGSQPANGAGSPGKWFEKLVSLQALLRAPGGCPWDREQTHATLRSYLLEEAYEVLDALERCDDREFASEMGDLLLQIIFHSQIAAEENRFTVADVIREVHDKMVRRHPHVFGDARVRTSAEVLKNWDQIKAQEKREARGSGAPSDPSLLDSVPRTLPAVLEGYQLTRRAAKAGFDWQDAAGVFDKIAEEVRELQSALANDTSAAVENEMGDLLFAAVNLARKLKIDPEVALKRANAKFAARFRAMEAISRGNGTTFAELPRQTKETLWETVKRNG